MEVWKLFPHPIDDESGTRVAYHAMSHFPATSTNIPRKSLGRVPLGKAARSGADRPSCAFFGAYALLPRLISRNLKRLTGRSSTRRRAAWAAPPGTWGRPLCGRPLSAREILRASGRSFLHVAFFLIKTIYPFMERKNGRPAHALGCFEGPRESCAPPRKNWAGLPLPLIGCAFPRNLPWADHGSSRPECP